MYSKHKDAPPEETIERIRGILGDIGIEPTIRMLRNGSGVFSAHLSDPEHGWFVNGKGTTEEYCLASAYGESMERLQAYYVYERPTSDGETPCDDDGFRLFPDEESVPVSECEWRFPEIYEELRCMYAQDVGVGPQEVDKSNLDAFLDSYFMGSVVTLPYYDMENEEVTKLPEAMISSLCGSNGLCAGNTPEEALNQGIAEILERHVKEIVFRGQLTPPDIPRSFLEERMPELYELIRQIEVMGPYSLVFKDVSLGKGMPVAGALFTNHKTQCYHVKFGASFSMEVAVERCLTELFQGFDLQNPIHHDRFMTPFDLRSCLEWENPINRISQLRKDMGSVPLSFFGPTPSWEFRDWEEGEDYGRSSFDNGTALRFMLGKLRHFSRQIYIRDCGFLGFPAYRIFVPGVSVTHIPLGPNKMGYKIKGRSLSLLRRYPAVRLTNEVLDQCYDFVTATDNLLLEEFDEMPLPAVRAVFYYVYGETERAIEALRSLPSSYKKYACAANELEMQLNGMDLASRDRILDLLFDEREARFARRVFRKDEGRTDHAYLIDALLDPQGKKLFAVADEGRLGGMISLNAVMRQRIRKNLPDQLRVGEIVRRSLAS